MLNIICRHSHFYSYKHNRLINDEIKFIIKYVFQRTENEHQYSMQDINFSNHMNYNIEVSIVPSIQHYGQHLAQLQI